jgi:hypothetical protein
MSQLPQGDAEICKKDELCTRVGTAGRPGAPAPRIPISDVDCFKQALAHACGDILDPLLRPSHVNLTFGIPGFFQSTPLSKFVTKGSYAGNTTFFNKMLAAGAKLNRKIRDVPPSEHERTKFDSAGNALDTKLLDLAFTPYGGGITTPEQVAFLLANGSKIEDLGPDPLSRLIHSGPEMVQYAVDTLKLPVKASHIILAMPLGGAGAQVSTTFNKLIEKADKSVLDQVSPTDKVSPLMKAFTQFEVSSFPGDRSTEPVCILLDAGANLHANGVYEYAKSNGKLCAVVPNDTACSAATGQYAAVQAAIAAADVTPTNSSAIDPVLDQWEAAFPSPPPEDVVLTPAGDAYKTQIILNKKLLPTFEAEVAFMEANWESSGGDDTVADPNRAAPRIQRVHDYVLNQFINSAQLGEMKNDYDKLEELWGRIKPLGQWWGGRRRSIRRKTRNRKHKRTLKKSKRSHKTKYTKRK